MRYSQMLTLIGAGFEDALRHERELRPSQAEEPALAELRLGELPAIGRDPEVPLTRQDELLAAAIRCYRRSHCQYWSSVVLQMLAPSLAWVCRRIIFVPRGLDVDDVQQQVVVHALLVADHLRLHQPPIWVRHRLVRRVRTMTMRWIRGADPVVHAEVAREDGGSPAQPIWDAIEELMELKAGGVPLAELGLLYRAARRVEAAVRRGDVADPTPDRLGGVRAARAGHPAGDLPRAA
jgi:hypothetical protein